MTSAPPNTGLYKPDEDTVQILVQGEPMAVITADGIVSTFDVSAIAAAVIAGVTIDDLPGTLDPSQMPAITGDVTISAGTTTATLAAGDASVLNNGTLSASRLPGLTGDVVSAAGGNATVLTHGSAAALDSGTLSAGRLPALTGDVTSSAGSAATTLAAGSASALNSGTLAAARLPALTGDVTSSAGSAATTLAAGSASVLNSGTLPAGRLPALTGDVTSSAGSAATTLAAGSASVLNSGTLPAGRMPALTGDVTTSAGAVATTIATGAVTYTKIQSSAAAAVLAATSGGTAFGEVTLNSTLEFSGSTVRRAALTGDVTASAGSNATTLAAGSASNLNSGTLPAGRMPALTGDVTTSAGAVATTIANNAVTYAKMQDVSATARLIGRATAGSGDPEEISLNATLSFTGTSIQRAALTGDVTASAGSNATTLAAGSASNLNSGTLLAARMPALTGDVTTSAGAVATTIANDAVTYAKMQNVSATDKVLGRKTAGSGDPEEIVCTSAGRDLIDDATASDQRTTLGLGTIATQSAASVSITGGTIAGTTMSSTTNDLGGASGAKGRDAAPMIFRQDNSSGVSITAQGADLGDVNSATCMATMPVACKIVKFSVNVQHGNGSNPGNWRLVVINDTATTNATNSSIDMSHVSFANNVTTGTLSSDLTFAAGDRIWCYIDQNGSAALSGCILSVQLLPVTT